MASSDTAHPFVHLRVHSAYSLLEGALTVARLAELASAQEMPALALTDRNNMFGALEFSETLSKAGIQPIIGCTMTTDFADVSLKGGKDQNKNGAGVNGASSGAIALIAKDETGYENLLKLTSMAFLDADDTGPAHITFDDLITHSEGLIVLTGGPEGPVDKALKSGDNELARGRLEKLFTVFGDRLYVELQRHGLDQEKAVEPGLLSLAYDMKLPLVAANQAFFESQDHFEAHDALICIAEGSYIAIDDRRRLSPEHYFKSAKEMSELFSDLPEALENTSEIAMRCAHRPHTRDPILPQWATDKNIGAEESLELEAQALKAQAEDGLRRRLKEEGAAEDYKESDYWERLELELGIITSMTYAGYFLIVADFIKWAKDASIPVGPGRGSGAGSVIAWALTITDLDPIRFGLLFERFLNPERVSMPDFDIDFCQDRRDEVITYVQEKYGTDRVAQIITFGKLQARAVLRDVGRVLHIPYGHVDRLCKMVPADPANPVSLAKAIAGEPRLQEERDSDPIVAKLLDIGQRLEGLYRHASTHAAGIVIGDRPLTELVPLYRDSRSSLPATQFNMKWVEAAGLVKFDFLGLKTLTVIEKAKEFIQSSGQEIDPARLPLDDKKTFALLSVAETVGVFQLESTGMRDALRKLKPDRFEDIIAMVALYRPGPMANIGSFINRKHGTEEPDYLHQLIRPILEETYGVIIYQEQVMQIAQQLSGYSLGEADLLRRAMGKKIKKEMDEQRARFVEGAIANKVEKGRAEYIFELVAKFAGYGFNKSHAAAYALLAYQTAYLKANHPIEFLAASMTLDMGNTDKLNVFVQDARRAGYKINPPCANASFAEFRPGENSIHYALGALKNMGRQSAINLVEERETNGPYENLSDFARRLDTRTINKRGVEAMIAAGALDIFETNRGKLFANSDRILRSAASKGDENQNDLFGEETARALVMRDAEPWLPMERLEREQDAIGFYISGHPLDEYEAILKREGIISWAEFCSRAEKRETVAKLAAIVSARQERTSARGNRYAFIGLSDQSGQYEAVAFSELLASCGDTLTPGTAVLVDIEAETGGDSMRARLTAAVPLDTIAGRSQSGIRIKIDNIAALEKLSTHLSPTGRGEVVIVLKLPDAGREIDVQMPGRYDVSPRGTGPLSVIEGVTSIETIIPNAGSGLSGTHAPPSLSLAKS